MTLFWQHLWQYNFLQYAIVSALLASLACGVIGSIVVVRRTTYVAGAIAHCVLGGMGMARYMQRVHDIEWMTPMVGATFAAVVAALIIAAVTLSGRAREDTVLSAIWAIGMAIGISFISITPGYYEDLMSYLFGHILMVGVSDMTHTMVLDAIIILVMLLFYNKCLLISFQPELARLRGINVGFYHTLLLVLIALTVVILTQVVGLILAIALLTLPAATALQFAQRLWVAMLAACALCFIFIFSGLAISYEPELPVGATVIEIAGGTYLLAVASKWLWKKVQARRQY